VGDPEYPILSQPAYIGAAMTDGPLAIDLQASAARLTDAAVATWAARQRVFISSVMQELVDERSAGAIAIDELGAEAVLFERFGGRDDDPEDAYLSEVASSTIYVVILGREYGRLLPSRLSATHSEYRHAERHGLRISAWVRPHVDRQADEQALLDEIQTFHVTGDFSTSHDLASNVTYRLRRIAAEDVSPWCKLDRAVFRAAHIVDDGRTVRIEATIHDPRVLRVLEALRPGTFLRSRGHSLTYAGHWRSVMVTKVVAHTEASAATRLEIDCEEDRSEPSFATAFSLHGYSDEEVTTISFRKALFGEAAPRDVWMLGGIGEPLSSLKGIKPPDEVIRPLLHLLITEAAVGSRRASYVFPVRLSTEINGRRSLVVEWLPPTNRQSVSEPLRVEGAIELHS
jgi:hypothetical protein